VFLRRGSPKSFERSRRSRMSTRRKYLKGARPMAQTGAVPDAGRWSPTGSHVRFTPWYAVGGSPVCRKPLNRVLTEIASRTLSSTLSGLEPFVPTKSGPGTGRAFRKPKSHLREAVCWTECRCDDFALLFRLLRVGKDPEVRSAGWASGPLWLMMIQRLRMKLDPARTDDAESLASGSNRCPTHA
jgi:hypothetical protein